MLYSIIRDVEYPARVRCRRGAEATVTESYFEPCFISVRWPDETPCVAVEMFLATKIREVTVNRSDGGTIRTYANHLSHLIRYCYQENINFWDLTSVDIDYFIKMLVSQVDSNNVRLRSNNTINHILYDCIVFLKWLQDNIAVNKNIIGVDTQEKRHQIKLDRKQSIINLRFNTNNEYYKMKPPAVSRREKKPMASETIKILWDTLSNSKLQTNVNKKLLHYYDKKDVFEHLEYLHKRRELQLVLLEATGLRPQELIKIEVAENLEYLEKSQLMIPTLKRRQNIKRVIPISPAVAMRIEVFIHVHRKKLVSRLMRHGFIQSGLEVDDNLYLNPETGKSVRTDAAYQEFRRLSMKANITQKNCQSMFRHRFITNMVKLHLMSFMDKNPLKSRHIITSDDYRTVLTKVARFTGHKDPNSLFHYIDLAWDELNAFGEADNIKNLQDQLQSIRQSLYSLKSDIEGLVGFSNKKLVSIFQSKLNQLVSELL